MDIFTFMRIPYVCMIFRTAVLLLYGKIKLVEVMLYIHTSAISCDVSQVPNILFFAEVFRLAGIGVGRAGGYLSNVPR